MQGFPDIPDFQALERGLHGLDDTSLAAACCALVDRLGQSPDGIRLLIDRIGGDRAERLYDALWQVHLRPHIRRLPQVPAYGSAALPAAADALSGLLEEIGTRPGLFLSSALAGLGDMAALDLALGLEGLRSPIVGMDGPFP
jgi:hypothetical protein